MAVSGNQAVVDVVGELASTVGVGAGQPWVGGAVAVSVGDDEATAGDFTERLARGQPRSEGDDTFDVIGSDHTQGSSGAHGMPDQHSGEGFASSDLVECPSGIGDGRGFVAVPAAYREPQEEHLHTPTCELTMGGPSEVAGPQERKAPWLHGPMRHLLTTVQNEDCRDGRSVCREMMQMGSRVTLGRFGHSHDSERDSNWIRRRL